MTRRARHWSFAPSLGLGALAALSWLACGGDEAAAPADASPASNGATTDGPSPADATPMTDGDARVLGDDADADAATASFCVRAADAGVPGPDASNDACLARLPIGAKNLRYYRSHPLDETNAAIKELVLIQHGNNRNAWDYYDLMAAAVIARDPAHTAVVAPHFQSSGNSCADGPDIIAPSDLDYACSDWKEGFLDKSGSTESYTALDKLIATAKAAFPSLVRVTVAGYSAGGQTVQRYAGGNTEHDRTPSITTRYVVGSPGSYMYLDGQRVKADAICTSAASCALDETSFEVPAYAPGCDTTDSHLTTNGGAYDDYKCGLANRSGYLASVPDAALVAQYVARKIVYVLSEGDSRRVGTVTAKYPAGTPTAYTVLDRDCPAIVQAPLEASYRLQRGLVFHRYVTKVFGATHRVAVVPACGHDDACVLTSTEALAEIFGP